jgi:branched-chain amino acid transport system substrate-binding protein
MVTTRRKFLKVMAGAGAAAGTGLGKAPAFAQDRPIKMGVIVARSGVMATVGEGGLVGVQWGVDRINKAGGILGRKIELLVEEETSPKETTERFRKLALQDKVDVISGAVSTGSGLALGPAAEELKMLWLSHDATTQKGVDETMPKPKYSFRSTDNECETVMASLLTVKHWRGKFKTVAGINLDYSYGRNNWEAFLTIMKKYNMDVTPVLDLWVPIGTIELTSHVAALKQKKPDLIFATLLFAEVPIFFKQAQAAGLTEGTKFVMPAAGFQHTAMKKAFTPEGILLGHNSMYFEAPNASPLLKEFVKDYTEKHKDFPHFESDRAYATVAAYKAGVEKAAKAIGGKWPTTDQVIQALEGLEVETLGGSFRYREDHIPDCNFYEGFTTAKNKYDFTTIDPVETMHTSKLQKPPGMKFYDWIAGWKV